MKNVLLALGIIVAGLAGSRSEAHAAARDAVVEGFCVKCVAGTGCGLEAALCAAWSGCDTGRESCSEFGTCSGGLLLIVCNTNVE